MTPSSFSNHDLSRYHRVLIILPGLREKDLTDRLLARIALKLEDLLGAKWEPQKVFFGPAMTYSDVDHALSLTDITLRVSFVRESTKTKPKRQSKRPA